MYWSTLSSEQRVQLLSQVIWPFIAGTRFPTHFSPQMCPEVLQEHIKMIPWWD